MRLNSAGLIASLLVASSVNAATLHGHVEKGQSIGRQTTQDSQDDFYRWLKSIGASERVARANAAGHNLCDQEPPLVDGAVHHPDWIPAYAYTNNDMVGVMHQGWAPFGKPPRQRPYTVRPFETMYMERSVARYWLGAHNNGCRIECAPAGPPGNFKFSARHGHGPLGAYDPAGPRGWLQDTGQTSPRGHFYRYWFAQPGTAEAWLKAERQKAHAQRQRDLDKQLEGLKKTGYCNPALAVAISF